MLNLLFNFDQAACRGHFPKDRSQHSTLYIVEWEWRAPQFWVLLQYFFCHLKINEASKKEPLCFWRVESRCMASASIRMYSWSPWNDKEKCVLLTSHVVGQKREVLCLELCYSCSQTCSTHSASILNCWLVDWPARSHKLQKKYSSTLQRVALHHPDYLLAL